MRIQVVIQWDHALRGLVAHDLKTGERLSNYSQLNYGDTPAVVAGDADDSAVLAATIASTAVLGMVRGMVRDRNGVVIDPAATHIGWATVPD